MERDEYDGYVAVLSVYQAPLLVYGQLINHIEHIISAHEDVVVSSNGAPDILLKAPYGAAIDFQRKTAIKGAPPILTLYVKTSYPPERITILDSNKDEADDSTNQQEEE
jgi:hypothetical protein